MASLNEKQWTVLLAGLVVLVALLSLFLGRPSPREMSASPQPTVPVISPEMVPLVTGEEPVETLFTRAGCSVCHDIPGIDGAEGRVGPQLVLGMTGPQRLAHSGYRGQAKTVREYVIESVLNPGAYVVPGYPDHVMPTWYGQKLTAQALDSIATYLEGLTNDGGTSRLRGVRVRRADLHRPQDLR